MLFGCHINIIIRLCLIEKALEINPQHLFQTERILGRNPSAVCNEIIDSLVRNSGTQSQFALRKILLCSYPVENSAKRNVIVFQILVVHTQCFSAAKLIKNNQIWLHYLHSFTNFFLVVSFVGSIFARFFYQNIVNGIIADVFELEKVVIKKCMFYKMKKLSLYIFPEFTLRRIVTN